MSSFSVITPTLAAAAMLIDAAANHANSAGAAVSLGQGAAFGSEPIGAAFGAMCGRAELASTDLEQTTRELGRNVGLASIGYLQTDNGILSITELQMYGGFRP
jgi:hypothetical protein